MGDNGKYTFMTTNLDIEFHQLWGLDLRSLGNLQRWRTCRPGNQVAGGLGGCVVTVDSTCFQIKLLEGSSAEASKIIISIAFIRYVLA